MKTAAELVRQRAAEATPTPWYIGKDDDDIVLSDWSPVVAGFRIDMPTEVGGPADARWIALASPALAEPLARALEAAERISSLDPDHECQPCGSGICELLQAVRDVAAVIEGGAR